MRVSYSLLFCREKLESLLLTYICGKGERSDGNIIAIINGINLQKIR